MSSMASHSQRDSSGAPAANGDERAAKRAKTAKLPAAIVLDIEGTVAPISFVTEVSLSLGSQFWKTHLYLAAIPWLAIVLDFEEPIAPAASSRRSDIHVWSQLVSCCTTDSGYRA